MPFNPEDVVTFLESLGLSFAAGVRTYITLIAIAVVADYKPFGLNISFRPGFEWMGSTWFLIAMIVMAIYESGVDKIPLLDHVNDIIHTVVRPGVGALILVGTSNGVSDLGTVGPYIAGIVGGTAAFSTHAVKSTARPVSTATTAGVANPIISMIEGFIATVMIAISFILPVIGAVLFVVATFMVFRSVRNVMRRRQQRSAVPTPNSTTAPLIT
jgi:Domain of unknown function (DUF4126)